MQATRLNALGVVLVLMLAAAPVAMAAQPLFSGVLAGKAPVAQDPFDVAAARTAAGALRLTWSMAPGTYLYRDKIALRTPEGADLPIQTPPGQPKEDPTFGATEIYRGSADVTLSRADVPAAGTLALLSQGCSDQGICFPPEVRVLDLTTLSIRRDDGARPLAAPTTAADWGAPTPAAAAPAADGPDASALAGLLSGSLLPLLAAFFGFGLLLAFTPCAFPMIPILSGMLMGTGERLSLRRGLAVSGSFAGAMAAAYGVLGLVAAASGANLQVALQTPMALGAMSAVFVVLALSMFGLFTLQVPTGVAARLSGWTGRGGGTLAGAAGLGFTSALVVGPCVTPPLAAALLYVAQSGDAARGAGALFALGLGMGLPLVAVTVLGSRLLPKAGRWLAVVKPVFGFVFLGVAISLLSRVVTPPVAMALWGGLVVVAGLGIAAFDPAHARVRLSRRALAGVIGGCAVLVGGGLIALAVAERPTRAFASGLLPSGLSSDLSASDGTSGDPLGRRVATVAELEGALVTARAHGRPILLDFTASWCVICADMERTVLREPQVVAGLAVVTLVRVDVTTPGPDSRALMQRYTVSGPPTLIFLDPATGREVPGLRTVGSFTASDFTQRLAQVGG